MQSKILLLMLGLGISLSALAQSNSYPVGYFRNPLGIPMQLTANFGELRADHWHMGLDLRTNQRENLQVYAAAGGYVAKIGIRPRSFGRFIVINHPNGLSTLYGHLNDFFPELEQYVTAQQYRKEGWAIELDFSKDQFPVSQGQFIAYSGNTGGSQGPHLHFEIFDTRTEKRLNPLLFEFPVFDQVPPTLVNLAMYDRSKNTYDQTPVIFSLKKTENGYMIPKIPVIKTGLAKISFALQAFDRINGSGSKNGIYSAKMSFDEEPQIEFVLDSINYNESVYINARIDYKYRHNGGSWLQHLSLLPGDHGVAFRKIKGDGVIRLQDTGLHKVTVEVRDAMNNSSKLNFSIQYDESMPGTTRLIGENSVMVPNQVNKIRKPGFEMTLPAAALYDTVQLLYTRKDEMDDNSLSASHQVNDVTIPIHNQITIRIKPDREIPADWKNRILVQRKGGSTSLREARWEGDLIVANFDDFGVFQVVADVIPPRINELGSGDTVNLSASSFIRFTPTDNFGEIKNFRAELDGQWIRFTNDKGRNWMYRFDERCPYGVHQIKVVAEDLAGNITEKSWWFKRYPYTAPVKKKKAIKKRNKK